MASPATLSRAFEGTIPEPTSYDWGTQTRDYNISGKYTGGSIRTFNSKGEPADSKADQDD